MAISWQPYGSTALPTFGENDIRYNTQTQNPNWGLTDNSPQFLGTNGWSLNNPYENTSMNDSWLKQNNVPDWFHNSTNVSWQGDAKSPTLQIKTGDKEGTIVPYSLQNGMWSPTMDKISKTAWDTNMSDSNRALAILAASMVGGAFMGMLPGATATIPGGFAGATIGEAGLGALGGGIGAGGAGGLGALTPEFASMGAMPGYDAAGNFIGFGPEGMLGTGAGTIPGAAAAGGSTIPSWLQSIGTKLGGMGLSSALSGLTGGGGSGGGGTGLTQSTQNNPLGGLFGGKSGGMGLLDMLGAYYSSRSNEKLGDSYMSLFNQMQSNAAPFMQRLQQSYADPNTYLQGPDYKAIAGLEENRLQRQKAKAGTNANDTDLIYGMQQHAYKNLDEYRKGLQTSVDATQRQLAAFAPFYISGMQNSTGSLAPWFSALSGMNTGAGGIPGLDKIPGLGNFSIDDIIKGVGGLLGSGSSGSDLPPSFDFGTRDTGGTFWAGEGLDTGSWDRLTDMIDFGPLPQE